MMTAAWESDSRDPLYWQMRRENDAFLLRQYWYWRHWANGALLGHRRRSQELARDAERIVARLIRQMGYQVHPTTHKCPFDLWVSDAHGRAIRVEVKISLYNNSPAGGRYQANIRQHHDADLLVFIARNGRDWPFIIPMADITPRRNIAIWSYCPGDYTGRWAGYLNAWPLLDQIMAGSQPADYQLSFPEQ